MENRGKGLLYSLLALLLCAVLFVGGTYALFTDNVVVNNHLSAGNLSVGLKRIAYQECVLDDGGKLTESKVNKEEIDLTKNAEKLFNVTKAVPTSWYEATVEVSNLGSIAFDYGVRVLWEANDDTADNDEIFASQIKITVIQGEKKAEFMLSECADKDVSLGFIAAKGEAQTFTLKAEFVNTKENNSAMLATLDFDMQVYATQKVSE